MQWFVIRFTRAALGARYQVGVFESPRPRRRGRYWFIVSEPMSKARALRLAETLNAGEAFLHRKEV